mgnify:CR=1 FL=1
MSYVMVDIEADGPIPGEYSMIQLGAVVVRDGLEDRDRFFGQLRPISENYLPDALAVSGLSRAETQQFDDPRTVMTQFEEWLQSTVKNRPIFISDNNGFDWMFVCWYFHKFLQRNPFGHSSQNLGSLYKGIAGDARQNFKHLRRTAHTHHPVDDAVGNAEALLTLRDEFGLKIQLE